MHRRTVLTTLAAAGGVAVAGCSLGGGGSDGSSPGTAAIEHGFLRYLQPSAFEHTFFGASIAIGDSLHAVRTRAGAGRGTTDVLVELPEEFASLVRVGRLLASELGLPDPADPAGPVDSLHAVGDLVFEGQFDVASVEAALRDVGLERAGRRADHDVFRSSTHAVAASSDRLVVTRVGLPGRDAPDRSIGDHSPTPAELADSVGRAVEAVAGDPVEVQAASDAAGDVLDALPGTWFTTLRHQPRRFGEMDSPHDRARAYGTAWDAVSGADGTFTATMALRFETSDDVPARAAFQSEYVGDGSDATVRIDGPLVVLEARYRLERL